MSGMRPPPIRTPVDNLLANTLNCRIGEFEMTKNVGEIDRTFRILAGRALNGWCFYAQTWSGAMGLVPLVTGVVGCSSFICR
jgi:hypothetical protein